MAAHHYDPAARRDTPLAARIAARIKANGPISLAEYTALCLGDPDHGYYTTRAALGAEADFITAPEITQIFGELIGIWCAVTWQQLGAPAQLKLIELGPGRGTMITDALRAMAKVPDLVRAVRLHLVDICEPLRDQQRMRLGGAPVAPAWSTDTADLLAATANSDGPYLVIGNEYLDALATAQVIAVDEVWHDRQVDLDSEGKLQFAIGNPTALAVPLPAAGQANGTVFEVTEAFQGTVAPLLDALHQRQALAALFIDYGHERSTSAETLQAVREHAYEHPLTSPGEADLTTQVDFEAFAGTMRAAGLAVDGPVAQAEFLGQLGIVERTSHLMAANPDQASAIESATQRIMAPNGMGTRFKAIAVRSPHLAPLPCLG